jgi:polysaccharide pyruvyl transferase WcaK-like protein
MNILVENSGYHLLNMGDVAMLQVALSRLRTLYPQAFIQVLTTDSTRLVELFPTVQPLATRGRDMWFQPLWRRLMVAKKFASIGSGFEQWLRQRAPSVFDHLLSLKHRNCPELRQEVKSFTTALYEADLVIATGGGYITDAFKYETIPRLATLELAARLGKPTVLMGQGLGPIQDLVLLEKAKSMLLLATLIGLREKRSGLPLLQAMHVTESRVTITGDDAIELAYNARRETIGDNLGINLRAAPYSGITETHIQSIRSVLHRLSTRLGVSLMPVPIDHASYEAFSIEADSVTIKKLLNANDSDGGASLDTPLKVIQQVGHCRVVITGSYHAGVFALSQGIPVIGLAKSEYYVDKFLGLADQFGLGCSVLLLDDPNLEEKLDKNIHHLWHEAEKLRPLLLSAARQQIQIGNETFNKIYQITQH